MEKPTLKWDGSHLGTFTHSIILESSNINGYRHVHLKLNSIKVYGILCLGNKIACIYDELKTLFGLLKTGSHSLNIGTKSYILYSCSETSNFFICDDEISNVTIERYNHLNLSDQIVRLFTFRHIIGVSPNSETGIRIRKTVTGFIYPVSFNDKFVVKDEEVKFGATTMSEKTYNKWFKDKSIVDISREILDIRSKETTDKINMLRSAISDIIKRIDKEQLWLENYINSNLHKYFDLIEVETSIDK